NGNTWEVIERGHQLRDGKFGPLANAVDTGETYDCVIAGGGISGIAAALFLGRDLGQKTTRLVLDDHAIFGGLAKRNEFLVNGQKLIANQASAMFFPPFAGSFLDEFYRSIGIDPNGFQYQEWTGRDREIKLANTPYFGGGSNSAFYFSDGTLLVDP